MSQIPPISGPQSDDALRSEHRGSREKKRPHEEDPSSDGADSMRPRPLSWHPSAPVEPQARPKQQLRSIEVHSILNPPAKSASTVTGDAAAEQSSSHQRLPSSPNVRLPSPALHPRRLSASPGMRNRQIVNPASPPARFVGPGPPYSRKPSASQSPLAQESRPGLYAVSPTSPMATDVLPGVPASAPGNPQSVPVSIQSTPTFHSRRTSANPTPNSSSQETSPSTPVSTYSQFGRSSPAISGAPGPQPGPGYPHPAPFGAIDTTGRLPSVVAGGRHAADEAESLPVPGMIPCILDLKSGSSSQAEKRKANSDASRRFRNRKRNEMQMEQKITAQQDEIRKQSELLQRQAQDIRALMQERDFYRSERDFYRERASRLGPFPDRPASPQTLRSTLDKDREPTGWPAGDAKFRTGDGASTVPAMPLTIPPGTWSSAPSAYSMTQPHTERGSRSDESMRNLPQFPGPWSRP